MPLWVEIITSVGAIVSPLFVLVIYLHTRATVSREKLNERVEELADRVEGHIAALAREMRDDHEAVKAQAADMALTIAKEYVSNNTFNAAVHRLDEAIAGTRRDIGTLGIELNKTLRGISYNRNKDD